ncbi:MULTISPECIES: Ppx/GppA phosphatase family protein [Arthrobacter]|uniref:Ppx/GppA phosphatase family protein n=1 Tax=Arthrobacter nanjingensis TaxID=1387716 RepID=A0ABU9KMU2_9MICC
MAAIDCGTNSIRLLIADRDAKGRLEDIERRMRVVRLGQDVDKTGKFAPEALERTFAAAEEYAALIAGHPEPTADGGTTHLTPADIRFVATSATRDARNRELFLEGIRERLGVEVEVISGDEEAALSFAGAASVLPPRGSELTLVVDLGGGSTEFVVGDDDGVQAARSVDIGCVRLTERHLRSDPPTAEEIAAAEVDVNAAIDLVLETVPLGRASAVVGVAGSITTITAFALGLEQYDSSLIHGSRHSLDAFRDACDRLLAMSHNERAALGFMHPGRVDVIGAGALVWRTILSRLEELSGGSLTEAVTSEHDILDGIALSID